MSTGYIRIEYIYRNSVNVLFCLRASLRARASSSPILFSLRLYTIYKVRLKYAILQYIYSNEVTALFFLSASLRARAPSYPNQTTYKVRSEYSTV